MAHPALDLAVKDKKGNTPFAAALAAKDSDTGQSIVQRDPKSAEQVRIKLCLRIFVLLWML